MGDEYKFVDEPPGLDETEEAVTAYQALGRLFRQSGVRRHITTGFTPTVLRGRNATLTLSDGSRAKATVRLSPEPVDVVEVVNRHILPLAFTAEFTLTRPVDWSLLDSMRWTLEQVAEAEALGLTGDLYPWPTRWKELESGAWVRTAAEPVWGWL